MADNRQMLDKWKDFRLSRYQQLDEEKIKMGFAGFDNYFKFIERDIKKVGDSIKRLIGEDVFDVKLINKETEDIYDYIIEKIYETPVYIEDVSFESPEKIKIAFNKFY